MVALLCVQVYLDPVYNTFLFHTTSGRSKYVLRAMSVVKMVISVLM